MTLTRYNIIKELKFMFRFDDYKELCPLLGIKWERTIWRWKREGTPENIFSLLKLIYNQQLMIRDLNHERLINQTKLPKKKA